MKRRGATYWFRASVPRDIANTYPKTEETFSLGTKDLQEAKKRLALANVKVDRMFDAHRRMLTVRRQPAVETLTKEQERQIEAVYYAHLLEEDEEVRLDGFGDAPRTTQVLDARGQGAAGAHGVAVPIHQPTYEEYTQDTADRDDDVRFQLPRGKSDVFWDSEVEEVLAWEGLGIKVEKGSRAFRQAVQALQRAQVRAGEGLRARNKGDVVETPEVAAVPGPETASTPLLSVALEKWRAEKERSAWAPRTAMEHKVWTERFLEQAGDRPLASYTKADARAFKETLLRLPPNWVKIKQIRNLPMAKAADKAHRLGLRPMSDKNVNKLLGFVGSFWSWAEGQYDGAPVGLFKGMKLRLKDNPAEARANYTAHELNVLFHAPVYTGCKSEHQWSEKGPLVLRESGKFWVPLIALFTGARLGEIVQLRVADIKEEDGVRFFHIVTEEDDAGPEAKTLKNFNSRRKLPIHPTLEKIGLLEFWEKRRKRHTLRLFPDLHKGADGTWSSPFSKYFHRFRISLGITRPKIAFHSLRHTFEDACRNSGVKLEEINALQGHSAGGMAAVYGEGFAVETLARVMKKVEHKGLDLSHLYIT